TNTGYSLYNSLKDEGFEINDTVYNKIKEVGYRAKNKDIAEVDPSIYSASDIGDYKDAAIMVISRYGGEENDLELVDDYGVPELSFHERERQTMEFIKAQGFEKVIVILNTGYTMETGWLKDYCDAALWTAFPGSYGFKGVAQILNGKQNPSGRLVDLYAENILSAPAMANWGDFGFSDLPSNNYHHEYIVYAEGIYVGYRYYESRYADLINGKHNANSSVGAKASSGEWNYAEEVVYPFGYGLSYASFSSTLDSVDWDRSAKKVTAKVTVSNTHPSVSGKYSVPLYASLPYSDGGIEKSAVQLIGYEKTDTLAPGGSQTLEIVVDDYLFASYDENATNGADTTKKGCYVFDEGDYYFAIGEDSHDALNNVLSRQGASGLYDQNGNAVAGNPAKAASFHLDAKDNTSHATSSVTGEIIYNRFQEVDVNYYIPGAVEYLTREDWETFPTAITDLKAADDASGTITKHMTASSSLYETPADAPSYKDFKHSQDVTIMFKDTASFEYDDERWETFLDQLKPAELSAICGEKMANDAIESVGYPANTSGDGPDGLQAGGTLHPSETLAAATFNKELLKKRGEFLGEDALYVGFSMVYGGGCNNHRTPYSGRNFEYYSEDPIVSYFCGRIQGAAMTSKGLISGFKHFLANDQETNRHGVATFMTEQTLRELTARGFEGALTDGAGLGNMGAYNRIGLLPTSSCKALMTDVLRGEWGFKGISITDSSKDATTYLFTADSIDAGTTLFNNDANRANDCKNLLIKQRDGHIWQCVREQAKNFFYAYSRSNVMNHFADSSSSSASSTPWWKPTIIAINVALGAILLGSIGGYVVLLLKEKRKEKEVA
ncbi:MAG: glycoside hydrolase family 3 C-terminal domain-containing protein, partial [Bacilli bacterium]|nr:glycoside hydrolase family 3 C-terminal domain-containing protein [Bacilli bacterium]